MMDRRQVAAYTIVAAFMVVTVGHVAAFTGSMELSGWAWLGWPYALAVDASIGVCAWLTRWKTTRAWAWAGYFAFTVASGTLNVAAVRPWAQASAGGAWVYAAFPTAAIALLGFLARDADALAERSARSKGSKLEQAQDPQPALGATGSNGHHPHTCAYCGATKNQDGTPIRSMSAHLRYCGAYKGSKSKSKREAVLER